MLEKLRVSQKPQKSEYVAQRNRLKEKLSLLQQQCKLEGLPVVILFEGWGSAGKGSRISDLVVDLDPRLFDVHTTEDPIGYEDRLPFMARFWSRIAEHGSFTIFDQAWYNAAARSLVSQINMAGQGGIEDLSGFSKVSCSKSAKIQGNSSFPALLASIESTERQLVKDGYLLVKFFLHITQETQRQRFIKLMLDEQTSWRVDSEDIRQVQHYPVYHEVFEQLLDRSNFSYAPWKLIDAHEKRAANLAILEHLVTSIEQALDEHRKRKLQKEQFSKEKTEEIARCQEALALCVADFAERERNKCASKEDSHKLLHLQDELNLAKISHTKSLTSRFSLVKVQDLSQLSHDKVLDEQAYKKELKKEQEKLSQLQARLYKLRIPVVIVYEGWDAAGKGGNIKRVARALDARSYVVHPISAPSSVELAHPFLWRFWTKIPRTGHIAIFDRSWYGRVMVERVERFAQEAEWKRAYEEINEFEAELEAWGAVLLKFWINVSPDEQLRRFQERQHDPAKQWKITEEDWRNREKNDLYKICVNDMFRLTSTEYAPWHIIESDDKRYARVKALKIINRTLDERLKK